MPDRIKAIAGKPAPTEGWPGDFRRVVGGVFCAADTRTGQLPQRDDRGDFWRVVGGGFCAAGTRTGQITDLWELACLRCRRRGFMGKPRRYHRWQASSHRGMAGGFLEGGQGCFLCGGHSYRADHGPVGAGLPAMQATRFLWVNRVDIIAGKPAPTEG